MQTDSSRGPNQRQPSIEKLGPAFFVSVPLWATAAILSVVALLDPSDETSWVMPIAVVTIFVALALTIWGALFGQQDR